MTQRVSQHGDERRETGATIRRGHIPCDTKGCAQNAICLLEMRFLCLDHFISYSYERLEQWKGFACSDPPGTTPETNDRFLQECLLRSEDLARFMKGIDNLSRARLFDIFLWTTEVSTRRSTLRSVVGPESGGRSPSVAQSSYDTYLPTPQFSHVVACP